MDSGAETGSRLGLNTMSSSRLAGPATSGTRGCSGTFRPSSLPSDSKKSPATSLLRAALAACELLFLKSAFELLGIDSGTCIKCIVLTVSSSSSDSSEKIACHKQ